MFLSRYSRVSDCGERVSRGAAVQTGSFLFPSLLPFRGPQRQMLIPPQLLGVEHLSTSEGLRVCVSVSHFWNTFPLQLELRDKPLRSVWYRDTVVSGVTKIPKIQPACSESKALTHVSQSLQDRDLSALALAVLTQQTTVQAGADPSQVQPNQSQAMPRPYLARHPPRSSSDSPEQRHGSNSPKRFGLSHTHATKTPLCIFFLIKMLLLVHPGLLEDDRADPWWMVSLPAGDIYILRPDYITGTSCESANSPPLN